MRKLLICLIAVIIMFTLCSASTAKADELSELKAQMKKIEEENARLAEQLNRQKEFTERLLEKIEALENKDEVLSKEVKGLKEKPMEPVLGEEARLPSLIDIPKLTIKGFSDVGFSTKISDSEDSNTFTTGALDLFITSEITDRLSFLTEAYFHFNTDTNASDFHLERAHLKYSFSDLLNIRVGRMHTPLGYWNQAFHHGIWIQTTIFRPEIYLFEDDDGGVLPIHAVGVELFGVKEFPRFDFEYNFDVLNGRGRTRTEIQNVKDKNDSKALNLLLSLRPHFVEGLKFGTNIYYDIIPSNPDVSTRTNQIDELILGGYVTYIHDRVEFLGEFFSIFHDDKTSGNDFETMGFYLQGGYKLDKFTPYYRFDFMDFESGDPYFTPIDIDINKHTLGLRWDIFIWNALKFEYSFSDKKNRDEHSFTVNTSFAF